MSWSSYEVIMRLMNPDWWIFWLIDALALIVTALRGDIVETYVKAVYGFGGGIQALSMMLRILVAVFVR